MAELPIQNPTRGPAKDAAKKQPGLSVHGVA